MLPARKLLTEIEIEASREAVWEVLADIDRYPDWNAFIPKVGGDLRAGGTVKVHIQPPEARAMTFRATVTRFAPQQALAWLGGLPVPGLFSGHHSFEIEPVSESRVRLLHREQFRGLLVPVMWRVLHTKVRRGFEQMNTAVKHRAESA